MIEEAGAREKSVHDGNSAAEMTLKWNDPLAVEITAAVQRGQASRVQRLVDEHAGLAQTWIVKDGEGAGSRTLLHLFADWPGHRRNAQEIVSVLNEAGADLNASLDGGETPLHWAASNDDVELLDALLDAGADIDPPGSIINGLGPIADACAFGGWRAGLRLVERGAITNLYQSAALGLMDRVKVELSSDPPPDAERITNAFWAACRGGHQNIAELLASKGPDMNWIGWTNETALDVARLADASDLVVWLHSQGGRSADDVRSSD